VSDPDSSFVVDASVSLAWLFEDEATPFTEAALDRVAQGPVWVPSLWTLECVNVLLSAQRRARISAAKREMLLERAIALPLNVDRTAVAMERIDALAARYGLSAYDAAYLELAIRLSVPLVTLDARLAKAARACGVEVHTAKS
jgi:predicted nucleic acid-binding protein